MKLAEDESQDASVGIIALHEVSTCSFIVAGLELEDQQYAIMCAPLITLLMISVLCGYGYTQRLGAGLGMGMGMGTGTRLLTRPW